jgi:hypothetical protein
MADSTYEPKVYRSNGGNKLTIASGGELRGEPGGAVRFDGAQVKVFNREAGTVDAFALQVKSEPTSPTAGHAMIEGTCDWEPSSAAQAGSGVRAVQGVSRLQAAKTVAGGSMIGVYGQVANGGTINGSGVMVAAMYGLLEAGGGAYTALSHMAAAWLDSHLTETVSAGSVDLLYMTNNGSTQIDNAFYIYGGDKVTHLFNLDTVDGMASITGVPDTAAGWIKIKVEGQTKYIRLYDAPTGGS